MAFILIACSTAVDGLWIEKRNSGLLKFYRDSVINNSNTISGRLGYRIKRDSLTWTGLNPQWNNGKTENSFKYKLKGDSLHIWFRNGDFATTYFKVDAENYIDYFLKRDRITLVLPQAKNVRQMPKRYENLDIKMGFRDQTIVIYIQDVETEMSEIGHAISRFKDQADSTMDLEFACRFFVDEKIPCEYTVGLFDYLRIHDIHKILFVTTTAGTNEYSGNFSGLYIGIPREKIVIVEEENEH